MKDEEYIEFLKSGISINSQLGCNVGCKYCIVGEFQKSVEKDYKPIQIIEKLKQHRFYNENIPLIINNRSEPLSPLLKVETISFLRLLKERNFKNPKILISKLVFGKSDIDVLDQNNVYIFRTISGMPASVEPPSNSENRRRILQENDYLKENTNAKIIHYWRPIVRDLNSDDKILENIFSEVSSHFDGSVVSGIRVTPNIKLLMERLGADLSDWNGDTNHKFLPQDVWNRILDIRNKYNPNYLLFRHTSCIISYLNNHPDYNLHYCKAKNLKYCEICPFYTRCMNFVKEIDENELKACFTQLGKEFQYSISDDQTLIIHSPIFQDEVSFLKMVLRYRIKAQDVQKSGSEKVLAYV